MRDNNNLNKILIANIVVNSLTLIILICQIVRLLRA